MIIIIKGHCQGCPRGRFGDSNELRGDGASCAECPAGRYRDTLGGKTLFDCLNCTEVDDSIGCYDFLVGRCANDRGQPVKVGGLKPGLALGPRGQPGGPRRPMTDMGDGRYTVAVDASWAPNRTADSLLVSFFDGDVEFSPFIDGGGADVNPDSLYTVRYGPAECSGQRR